MSSATRCRKASERVAEELAVKDPEDPQATEGGRAGEEVEAEVGKS